MKTIKEIYLKNEISKEAFDVCFYNEIDFLEELKEYHTKNGSFKNFKNCSSKTNNELLLICLETFDFVAFSNDTIYKINGFETKNSLEIDNFILDETKINDFTIVNFLNNLSINKAESINNFISLSYNSNLCFKSRNNLKFYLSNEINIKGFSRVIFKEQFHQLKNRKLIGRKSTDELEIYLSILNEFIMQVYICQVDSELTQLTILHINDYNEAIKNSKKVIFSLIKKIDGLSFSQIQLINYYISFSFSKLSVSSSKALKIHLSNEININGFSRAIFQNQFFQLRNLKNIGEKYTIELGNYLAVLKAFILQVAVCQNKNELKAMFFMPKTVTLSDKIKDLSFIQEQIINNYILTLTFQLSARSNKAINIYLENKLNINSFSDNFFSNSAFQLNELQNIGKGSIKELEDYLKQIKQFSIRVINLKDESELNKLEIKIHLNNIFKDNSIPEEIVDDSSIFMLVDYLINRSIIFSKEETYILKSSFYVYINNEHKTTWHIGKVLGVTRERARQRKITLLEDISSKFNFLKFFDKKLLSKYNIAADQASIVISDEKAEFINNIDNTNFSKQFITLNLSFLLEEEFKLIGNKKDSLLFTEINLRDRYNWKNIYLIQPKLLQVFYFEKLIEDLAEKSKEQNNKTYKLNFKSYLSKFFKTEGFIFLEEILPVCEMLINEELGICLDGEQNLVFIRNTYIALHDYAYDALEILGKPSHIDDINKQIKILKPDYNNIVSSTTLKRKFGFIPYGRANIFGLKKWDYEKENLKGGTIRSIVQEFLENNSTPIHIKKITEYVLKFRPETNENSIRTNLNMDEHNIFEFYKGPSVGLKSKKDKYFENSLFETNKNLKHITFNKTENNFNKASSSDQTTLDFPD